MTAVLLQNFKEFIQNTKLCTKRSVRARNKYLLVLHAGRLPLIYCMWLKLRTLNQEQVGSWRTLGIPLCDPTIGAVSWLTTYSRLKTMYGPDLNKIQRKISNEYHNTSKILQER